MFYYALAFLMGDGLLQLQTSLPNKNVVFALTGLLCILAMQSQYRRLGLLAVIMLGFSYSCWFAQRNLEHRLSEQEAKQVHLITGQIISLPTGLGQGIFQFSFRSEQPISKTLRLSWANPPTPLQAGQVWRLHVKLKPLHATANPYVFDYMAWTLVNDIAGVGYVNGHAVNKLVTVAPWRIPLTSFRQVIFNRITPLLPQTATAHWLPALLLGERQGISQQEWRLLRATGTNHLMAIAGLHLGLVVAMSYWLSLQGWRCSATLCLRLPSPIAASVASWLLGLSYSTLAGFSLPTLRAMIMLSMAMLAYMLRRHISPWQGWSVALLVILILNPLQIITESFCLSFAAIALIFYGMQHRLQVTGLWWHYGRVQWVISLGLLPLSLWLFHECSLIALIANLIAIPWLLFTILPCCLLALIALVIYPPLAAFLLRLADNGVWVLFHGLDWFSHLPLAIWYSNPPTWCLLLAMLGVLIILSPLPRRVASVGVVWLLPAALYQASALPRQAMQLTVFDVGQGLAVLIETAHQLFLYDTGLKVRTGGDMAERVIVPYLKQQGNKPLTAIIISHNDLDHSGGVHSVLAEFKSTPVYAAAPISGIPTHPCFAGLSWHRDGVEFTFLHPPRYQVNTKNNNSCVLRISNGQAAILLPGDIEKAAEMELVKTAATSLGANVLIAPHHGSKTSSTIPFIHAVQPDYVIYSVGYHNRYHFPQPAVVQRYAQQMTNQYTTVQTGMIQFRFLGKQIIPHFYRLSHRHYWD